MPSCKQKERISDQNKGGVCDCLGGVAFYGIRSATLLLLNCCCYICGFLAEVIYLEFWIAFWHAYLILFNFDILQGGKKMISYFKSLESTW